MKRRTFPSTTLFWASYVLVQGRHFRTCRCLEVACLGAPYLEGACLDASCRGVAFQEGAFQGSRGEACPGVASYQEALHSRGTHMDLRHAAEL